MRRYNYRGARRRVLAILVLLCVSASAHARPGGVGTPDAGHIDELWRSYLQHFESDDPPEVGPWRCSTMLVQQLREQWVHFTPAQRAQMTAHIAPWKADLLESPAVQIAPPETRDREDTCWGQRKANRVTGTHFVVEWDSEDVTEQMALDFLDALETSWDVEVSVLGWQAPPLTDEYFIGAYIEDPGPSGGYCSIDDCGNEWMPYIVAGISSFDSSWYKGMASHEFNHAMQFGYGRAMNRYWWEASAMYIEPFVFPEEDDWIDYILGYTYYPHLSLSAWDNDHDDPRFAHGYGMVILAMYMDEYVGGPDLVRQTWEESQAYVEDYGLSLQLLAPVLGYDWDVAYRGFMATNTVMDYADGEAFPPVTLEAVADAFPASGAASAGTWPQTQGQNYIQLDTTSLSEKRSDLRLSFRGASHGDWAVLVVGTVGDEVQIVYTMDLDTGVGEQLLEDAGQYERVFLVASPTDDAGDGLHYEWSAEALVEPEAGDDDDSASGDDDDSSSGDDDDTTQPADDDSSEVDDGAGCACSQAPRRAPLVLVCVLVWVVARRRRLSPRSS